MSDQTPATKLLQGRPFGAVWPPRDAVSFPAIDGRTVALKVLRLYISELTFHLRGSKGSNTLSSFRIPIEKIHVEQPDNVVALDFPSIVFVPGAWESLPIGLATFLEEGSKDRFHKGTALQAQFEYQETITIECWAKDKPTRRAMASALQGALNPTESMYGIRFRMPDYYDGTVCFSLQGGMRPDDPDNVRNRRWEHLTVEMRFDAVRLVNVEEIRPEVELDTFEPDQVPTGVEFEVP